MTRYDAVNYISHGIAKRPGLSEARPVRGADEDADAKTRRRAEEEGRRARRLLRQPQQEGARGQDRSADRPRDRDQPHHPGAVPPAEEQSAVRRRSRRRQDRDRRGPGAPHHPRRSAGGAAQRHRVRARHGHAARRHALSRRLRGAAQAGDQGDRGLSRRDPVHRRDPHRDRRRRHLGRRDGRVEPAEAGAGRRARCAASARPPTRNTASTSRRTARWCAASRRSTSTSRRSPTPSRSSKGLKPYFEEYHKLKYTNEAIKAAVELSARYINDRKLPDKAIDVIDESGAAQMLLPEAGAARRPSASRRSRRRSPRWRASRRRRCRRTTPRCCSTSRRP